MPAEHAETHSDRRRQQEPDRPPQPGPERRGKDHGDRREAGAAAVEQRFDYLADQGVDYREQAHGEQGHGPARIDRNRHRDRERRRDQRADVRHEPQHHRHDAEQCRIGHADEGQAGADDDPEPH